MNKYLLIVLVLFVFQVTNVSYLRAEENHGHDLKFHIKGVKDTSILLVNHMGKSKYIKDTIWLDSNGKGRLKGDDKIHGGLYLLLMPNQNFFEFLIGKDQHFSVYADTSDLRESRKIEGSIINKGFFEYTSYMQQANEKASELRKKQQENPEDKSINEKLKKINEEVQGKFKQIQEEYAGTLLAKFIKATESVDIPDFDIPDDVENKDSLKWLMSYQYNKKHYFDNIDFSDSSLLYTPFLDSKLDFFLTKLMVPIPDSIIPATVDVIDKARANKKVFQFVLSSTFNHYLKSEYMGMDAVWVALGERYYLSGMADWADTTFLKELKENIYKTKPNLIGKVAPEMRMEKNDGSEVSLHSILADYTVVIFWEPGCGHCKKAVPKLYEVYKKYRDYNVEVFAVYTQYDTEDWKKYLEEHKFDWLNVWDYTRSGYFKFYYNIRSTPMIYLLDKNKKIIAKKIGVETVEKILKQELNL